MDATHTVNHHDPLPPQIAALDLSVPLKYIFITHSTEQYLAPCAEIAAPLRQSLQYPASGGHADVRDDVCGEEFVLCVRAAGDKAVLWRRRGEAYRPKGHTTMRCTSATDVYLIGVHLIGTSLTGAYLL
jgi:hypothetical protein